MIRRTCAALLICASLTAAAGCAPRHYYGRGDYTYGDMTDRDAWEIVRRDPCRYDEYRRFAHEHKNPAKRRAAVWRLAHEGCRAERQYEQQQPYYDDDRGYDDDYR